MPGKTKAKSTTAATTTDDFGALVQQATGDAWEKNREQQQGRSSGPPEIDDGVYSARLQSVTCGTYEKNNEKIPYIAFNYSIAGGPFNGKTPSEFVRLTNEKSVQRVLGDLQTLDYDTKDMSTGDLQRVATELSDRDSGRPFVQIKVKNTYGQKQADGTVPHYQNVYLNKLIDESDIPSDDEPSPSTSRRRRRRK